MELPDTLLPAAYYDEWKAISVLKEESEKDERVIALFNNKLPKENRVPDSHSLFSLK
jgi:hypothetical protein